MHKIKMLIQGFFVTCTLFINAQAADVLTQKNSGLEAANDIAKMSIDVCREKGFQCISRSQQEADMGGDEK